MCKPWVANTAAAKDHLVPLTPIWICGGFPREGSMSCSLLMLSSHSCCHLPLMCVVISGFRSEWGISHGSTSQFRPFLQPDQHTRVLGCWQQVDVMSIFCQLVHFLNDLCHERVVCYPAEHLCLLRTLNWIAPSEYLALSGTFFWRLMYERQLRVENEAQQFGFVGDFYGIPIKGRLWFDMHSAALLGDQATSPMT